jgi:excisionase family DNA binding protein
MNPNSSPTTWRDYAYLTWKTAAKYLRVNPYTLWKHREEIPFLKAGRHYLYEKKELDRQFAHAPEVANLQISSHRDWEVTVPTSIAEKWRNICVCHQSR